jgi:hypothetical protein
MQSNHFIDLSRQQSINTANLAQYVYQLVCRCDFIQPGFALVRLPKEMTSLHQRRLMVDLKEQLSLLYQSDRGTALDWFNMTRFDQKNTTKPHRDGAPNDSLLLLGYEPTTVQSKLSMADYSKCAQTLGITPAAFLEDCNPMYEKGLELLAPYTIQVSEFDITRYQLLIINNSCNPLLEGESTWQGVLHCATVSTDSGSRVINSTSICPAAKESPSEVQEYSPVSAEAVNDFLSQTTLTGTYSQL